MNEVEIDKLSIEEIYQKVDKCQIDIGITNLECQSFFEKLWKRAEKENNPKLLEEIKKDYFLFQYQETLKEEDLTYYKRRFDETNNPILKVRYCEVLIREKLDFDVISHAYDSYLKLSDDCIKLNNENLIIYTGLQLLERSLVLALKLKNEGLIGKSISKHLEILKELEKLEDSPWVFGIIKSLFSLQKKEFLKMDLKSIEIILKKKVPLKNKGRIIFTGFEDWLYLLIKFYSLTGENKKKNELLLKVAKKIRREVNDLLDKKEIGHIHASVHLQKALDYTTKAGGSTEKLTSLKIQIGQQQNLMVQKEMVKIEGSFTISKEEIDIFVKQFEGKTNDQIISILCSIPIISYEVCKKAVSEIQNQSILGKIQHNLYVNGLLKAETSEENTVNLQAKWFHINENLIIAAKISKLFEKFDLESPDFYDKLVEYFRVKLGNLTDITNFIEIGLNRFSEEDYVSAIHLLVFQCEAILRKKLKEFSSDFYIRQGTQVLIPLGGVIRKLGELNLLPEDLLMLLEHFLTDQESHNLRNKIAHGFSKIIDMSRINCIALIFYLIKLACDKI